MNYIKRLTARINIETIVYFIFYMLVCFPFTSPIRTGTDTQPWALLFSVALFAYYGLVRKDLYSNGCIRFLLWLFVASLMIGIISIANVSGIGGLVRSGANYASVFFIPVITYYILKKQHGLREGWIKIAIWIWLIVGITQKYFIYNFAYGINPNARTSAYRGVVSLASEPSFYGYMCIFFLIFALEFKQFKVPYILLLLFEIVLLADSSLTMLYLLIFIALFVIEGIIQKKLWGYGLLSLGVSGLTLSYFVIPLLPGHIRAVQLLRKFLYNPADLAKDESVTTRLYSIVSSFEGFVENFGLPHGFGQTRIISGYGAAIYELGFVGLILITFFVYLLWSGKHGLVVAVGLTIIMFSGIQLACPMLGFLIGYCIYRKYDESSNDFIVRSKLR